MKLIQRFFNFYIAASIHVAFAVFLLLQVSFLTLDINADHHLSWFLFFGTVCCYNFIKYGVEAQKYVLVANAYHRNIQFISLAFLGLALYHGYFLSRYTWLGIGLLLIMTGLYALPVLPRAKGLRSLGVLKVFIVALVWSGATLVLPSLARNTGGSAWDIGILAVQRFVFVLIVLIPFEIRDLKYDSADLKTLPQRFGVAKTKVLGAFLSVVFFFITFLKDDVSQPELIANGALFLLLGSLMYCTKRSQSRYFASFWVEGIPFLWYVLLYVLRQLF